MSLFVLSLRRLVPLAGALALGASVALAQPYGAPYGQAYGRSSGSEPSTLSSLHAALNISAAQEDAWRAFVAASQPDPQQQARQRAAQQMLPRLTAPQRVDLSIAEMRADLETLRQRGVALKVFYAALTPAQRTIFDRQTLPRQNDGYGG